MSDSLNQKDLQIPEYDSLVTILHCSDCYNEYCRYSGWSSRTPGSLYECVDFIKRVSIIKGISEAIIGIGSTVCFLIFFKGFWLTALKLSLIFASLLIFDFFSDKLIKSICIYLEKRRREKYDKEVQEIKERNEAIKKANLGISGELEKFLDSSKSLHDELRNTFDSIKEVLNIKSKAEKRVVDKFQDTIKELETLNGKLYDNAFESSYITTLYEIHLPKLLEYAKQFLLFHNSKILTPKQITEFSNLLEVFRVKIASHTEYLQNKIEDDFIIKMQALNEDVLPNFDGSEVKKDG